MLIDFDHGGRAAPRVPFQANFTMWKSRRLNAAVRLHPRHQNGDPSHARVG